MNTVWNEENIKLLIELYPNIKNVELSKLLNINQSTLETKANSLKLKKSKEHKSKMITLRNKSITRDLSINKLTEIALEYNSRSEFQYKDPSAYSAAQRLKILDSICSHMIKLSFSIPQLMLYQLVLKLIDSNATYNNRQVIKPKELDIYSQKYKLAFEYDGKGWHINDNNDKIKICKNKNILLLKIIENNRKYEIDIKEQFINYLHIINNITLKNITEQDVNNIDLSIVYNDIYNYNDIEKICNKYTNYSTFIKNEPYIHNLLKRQKLIDKYTQHMVRNRVAWSEELIMIEISKYTHLDDFYINSFGCYSYISKNKQYKYLLNNLIRKKK